jgi:3'-phosphoadenosine 5'-phosphosulfate sulfotransferase (PAPS reductase)/FAD synthetase
MDQVPGYEEIDPPDDALETEAVPKPQPDSDPLEIFETNLIDTSGVGHGLDRAVLFSGGDDSLALTHMAMENGWANLVIHLETNSSIPENIDYVRKVCREYQWPLIILASPMSLFLFACRYGFSGPQCHTMAYSYFKGRQLAHFERHREGDVKYFSGVRRLESDRRMENIDAEVEYEGSSNTGDFTGWWVSPLIDKSDEWVAKYRDRHDLPRNPVARNLHRSGDCHCLAFGHRDEELTLLQAEYPEFAEWLLNVERRVQEYRGRIAILEKSYPEVYDEVKTIRESDQPYPMKLSVLQEAYPTVYDEVVSVDSETAILTGQQDETNFIGHGGLSSKELRAKMAQGDVNQQTLCETCQQPADSISRSVRHRTEEASTALAEQTTQACITGDFGCAESQ